jgi:Zn-dependent M28 family amino/carboxypeptidase
MFIQIDRNYDQYMSRIKYYLETPRMTLDRTGSEDEEDLTIPYIHCSERMAEVLLKNSGYKNLASVTKSANKGKHLKSKKSRLNLKIHIHVKREDMVSDNVLAFLEGEDPELRAEVVVISAHYDHVGIINGQIHNGADDDGSGTVSVMEIAKAFVEAKKEGHGPKRSILFLHVSGEEKGLLGSEWYSDHPVYPLVNTVCDLNIDMVGRKDADHDDDRYVYLIGSDKLSTDLHKISENCNQKYTQLKLDYTYNDPNDPNQFYYRSDHYNFAKHNIPVIFYFSGVHEDYHKPGDDPEKILYSKMTEIDQLVFHTAWDIANRAEKLKVDVINDFNNK